MTQDFSGSTILAGGHVIDPANGIDGPADLAIKDGRILAVGTDFPKNRAKTVLDAAGLIVTPGLVDIHTHLFTSTCIPDSWAGDLSVSPDAFSFRTGVTTMVDAGSAGWKNFGHFKTTVMDRAKTRVLAFLNIASFGMMTDTMEQDEAYFDAEKTAKMAREYSGVVVGIKTAHYWHPDWMSVDRALLAGEKSGLPIMVDFGYFRKERPYWELVGKKLRPGDFSTHCLRGPVPVLDREGRVFEYLFRAHDRGVLFDLGHGGGSFLFRNAVPAVRQGVPLDTISTDLHVQSMNLHMMDMPTTMSKILILGMSLKDVVKKSTCDPARFLGRPDLGRLTPGDAADIAVWNLLSGKFGYSDSNNGLVVGDKRLQCEMTFKDGEVVWDWNSRSAVDYTTLGPAYGIRDRVEYLLYPEEGR